MDLIVDANILFAALIRAGATRQLFFEARLRRFAPEFLMTELSKHREEILNKSRRQPPEFDELIEVLYRRIRVVPKAQIEPHLEEGQRISPDPNDALYFATALAIGASIWTNESRLKSQDKVRIYTTRELIELFLKEV